MLKSSKFTYNGKTYEIRAATLDNEIKIRLFESDRLASPVSYTIPIETAFDAQTRGLPLDLVDEQMKLMEEETVSGRLKLLP